MLRGIHAFEKKGWDRLFWVGLRSACGGEVTVPGAYFHGFSRVSFPHFSMYVLRFIRVPHPDFVFFTSV
jgi:hypothetical protein